VLDAIDSPVDVRTSKPVMSRLPVMTFICPLDGDDNDGEESFEPATSRGSRTAFRRESETKPADLWITSSTLAEPPRQVKQYNRILACCGIAI